MTSESATEGLSIALTPSVKDVSNAVSKMLVRFSPLTCRTAMARPMQITCSNPRRSPERLRSSKSIRAFREHSRGSAKRRQYLSCARSACSPKAVGPLTRGAQKATEVSNLIHCTLNCPVKATSARPTGSFATSRQMSGGNGCWTNSICFLGMVLESSGLI